MVKQTTSINGTPIEGILTGVAEIDDELRGGITTGSLVLIEGESGTGKSVLTQHLIYKALLFKKNAVAYYTTDNSVKSLIEQMNSLSLPVLDYLLADWLRIYPAQPRKGFREAKKSLLLLTDHIPKLPERFNLVVVDCLTVLLNNLTPQLKVDFFYNCRELCQRGRSIFLIVNSRAIEQSILQRACLLCDDYLKLKSEEIGNRLLKILEVPKMHGVDYQAKSVSFEVKPKVGIKIVPFGRFKC